MTDKRKDFYCGTDTTVDQWNHWLIFAYSLPNKINHARAYNDNITPLSFHFLLTISKMFNINNHEQFVDNKYYEDRNKCGSSHRVYFFYFTVLPSLKKQHHLQNPLLNIYNK